MRSSKHTNLMNIALTGRRACIVSERHELDIEVGLKRDSSLKLNLPTGRFCATDLIMDDQFLPFNVIVQPGAYAVEFVVAKIPKRHPYGGECIAFVVIDFQDGTAVSWEPATVVGIGRYSYSSDMPNSFIQEATSGIFSPEAGRMITALKKRKVDMYSLVINARDDRKCAYGIDYSPGSSSLNAVVFEGGFGDGISKCYNGFNSDGRLCKFIIDFNVISAL
jgi:hypothetical protein